MTRYQIIYWRDIPVRIRVRQGKAHLSGSFSPRFQKTVYRAAYRAKAITGDDYTDGWRPSDWRNHDQEAGSVLQIVTAEIEAAYSDDRLDALARNKGYESNDDSVSNHSLA